MLVQSGDAGDGVLPAAEDQDVAGLVVLAVGVDLELDIAGGALRADVQLDYRVVGEPRLILSCLRFLDAVLPCFGLSWFLMYDIIEQ